MSKEDIRKDSEGQFAPSQADGSNDGLASAVPRAVTGKDDATLANADDKPAPKQSFDEKTQTNNRG